MSQHASLKGSGKITSRRNVLKRFERVDLLRKRGEWKEGSRGLGLKKTKPEAYDRFLVRLKRPDFHPGVSFLAWSDGAEL